jgi:hypothetical protein
MAACSACSSASSPRVAVRPSCSSRNASARTPNATTGSSAVVLRRVEAEGRRSRDHHLLGELQRPELQVGAAAEERRTRWRAWCRRPTWPRPARRSRSIPSPRCRRPTHWRGRPWPSARARCRRPSRPDPRPWPGARQVPSRPCPPRRDGAWRSLRDAAGLPGFRFHDLRHTVVTDLLEAGEPEHVIEAVTGHLSRKMLEHYSHQRLKLRPRVRWSHRSKSGARRGSLSTPFRNYGDVFFHLMRPGAPYLARWPASREASPILRA